MTYVQLHKLPEQITIADYICYRLKQLNIKTVFGLPGEFNMPLLDKIYEIDGMRWAGNANELNAAYAADGYSRIKGLACLITTFGVGELSVLNGVAGSYAEHVGILHIIGMPPTSAQTKQLLLHHTLGNGDYNVFYRMGSDIACHSRILNDSELCYSHVDKCIEMAWNEQRPVYLGIPVNRIQMIVPSSHLNQPLNLNTLRYPSDNNNLNDLKLPRQVDTEYNELVDNILKKIYSSERPIIVIDAGIIRHQVTKLAEDFIKLTQFPSFVTPMGKGSVNENLPNFDGVFTGSLSRPNVKELVDNSDCVIVLGCLLPEFSTTTFHFGYRAKAKNKIFIYPKSIKMKNITYPDIYIEIILQKLLLKYDPTKVSRTFNHIDNINVPRQTLSDDQLLKQEWVWHEFSKWFKPGDVIVTEVGSSAFGITQIRFPPRTLSISQPLWGSSGFSIGACLGVLFATNELKEESSCNGYITSSIGESINLKNLQDRRIILFVGDGAFQISMQEISTMIRWNLTPYIFLLNNAGYSVDRFMNKKSNSSKFDVQPWKYLDIFKIFGAMNYETRKIVTLGDLREMLNDTNFNIDNKIRLVEIILPSTDVPPALLEKWIRERTQSNVIKESPRLFETPESSEFSELDDITPHGSKHNSIISLG